MVALLKPEKFWEIHLYQFSDLIAEIRTEFPENYLEQSKKAITVCIENMDRLRDEVKLNGFSEPIEEIHFFKEVKPKFYSQLIYFHKIYNIEIGCPVGSPNEIKAYFEKELVQINAFFEEHKFFYSYIRHEETLLDEKLFLRNGDKDFLPLKIYDINASPGFSTKYDYVFSRIKADEMLLDYLQKKLTALNAHTTATNKSLNNREIKTLTWTDPKVGLIELIYALKAKGSFNNGKATIKEITDLVQEVFGVEITNPSRDFQEILRRKTGYTNYLDTLKDSYLKYIDLIESK